MVGTTSEIVEDWLDNIYGGRLNNVYGGLHRGMKVRTEGC